MTDVCGIDHIYISVSNMQRSEAFYDQVFLKVFNFRKNSFELANDSHIQYYNRHFGYVLRPAASLTAHDSSSAGLHHLCLRVETVADVKTVAGELSEQGIEVSAAALYPEYAEDYWACYFIDPDGIQLEVTNYREERRERLDHWELGE